MGHHVPPARPGRNPDARRIDGGSSGVGDTRPADFIPANGPCTLTAAFGAPRPDWVSVSGAVEEATGSTASLERVAVDLSRLDGGLQGCFDYVFDRVIYVPRLFGGASSCDSWPQGSFIEYASFSTQPVSSALFEVPAGCVLDAASPSGPLGCTSCHDTP
jgi:hypothetical protein